MSSDQLCEYTGKFYRRLYRKEDGSYCVCLYQHKGDTTTVVGSDLPEVNFPVTFRGKWTNNPKFGRQFTVEGLKNTLPENSKDICRFIASLKIGIGERKAEKILGLVGADKFWDELERDPMQFTSISGIQTKSVLLLQAKVAEMTIQQKLFRLFAGDLPMDNRQYKRICAFFRSDMESMVDQIKDNPFILMRCGYSFEQLDFFCSRHTAYPVNDSRRLLAAAQQALMNARQESHVALPCSNLLQLMQALLNKQGYVEEEDIEAFLLEASARDELVYSHELYYLPRSYQEECQITDAVIQLVCKKDEDISYALFEQYMKEYAQDKGFSLSADQQNAVLTALTKSICIITGGPGTGKSTILDALLYCWKKFFDDNWMLMAPTGKASVRMTETTQQPASTLHSSLGLTVGSEDINAMDTSVCDNQRSLLVVDECSMLDQTVSASLTLSLESLKHGFRQHLVLVGDPEQLPSVGWGNVLADMIASEVVPVCRLGTIYRQGEGNPIITNSAKMLAGITELDWSKRSFRGFHYGSDEKNVKAVCDFYLRCVKAYGIENTVLLSPYHKATDICTDKLNAYLQEAINPDVGQGQIKMGSKIFRKGDRVMQLKNTECLSNGDVGVVTDVYAHAPEDEPCIAVTFESGTEEKYYRDGLHQLDLAYGISIHKSQGSQYQNVLIILPCRLTSFLRRNLLYTAITRSSQNVAIFAPESTIAGCILNDKKDERFTNLRLRLQEKYNNRKKAA